MCNGHPGSGPWRQLKCVVCGPHFQETLGTLFYGSRVTAQDIIRGIVALSEGVSPRGVGRIFWVDKDTVLRWLVQASAHVERVLGYVIHELELDQVQMDELYALLRDVNEEGRRTCWVWAAIDPVTVHYGQAQAVLDQRQLVLQAAYAAHPERFVRGEPKLVPLPTEVWINKPPPSS